MIEKMKRWMSESLHPYAYIHDCDVHYITHILDRHTSYHMIDHLDDEAYHVI